MIGRQEESIILENASKREASSMIAVIGRRRVGKTYLINTVYQKQIVFNLIGQKDADRSTQLQNFADKLQYYTTSSQALKRPDDWQKAFGMLRQYLKRKRTKNKVVFFDEVPWLDTHRSGFLSQLSYFWNDWGVHNNITLVICGSAALWMIEKVVNDKGGLHNRIDHLIELQPFTLTETKQYLYQHGVRLNNYQISQLYMAIGGIPYYLQHVLPGKSASHNIQYLCFDKNGPLRSEFDNLYAALFDNPEGHIAVIRALAKKWKGMTREEIIKESKLSNGGGLSKILDELNRSSFIMAFHPFGKKKRHTLYRLTDEYSLFYLTFINKGKVNSSWQQMSQSRKVSTWYGYAFESLCLKHVMAIKKALGISGVYSEESAYLYKGNKSTAGFQIDLIIDLSESAMYICEMKYYNDEIVLTKSYAEKLRKRKAAFALHTKTKKQLFTTLITIYGLRINQHSAGLIDRVVTLDEFM